MSDPNPEDARETAAEEPTTEDLEEPSTEKDPGDEPKAGKPREAEPSHHAVGIGVIDDDSAPGAEPPD